MSEKLKDYQVLDVFCGGTFYKVKHKVTNNIYAWKAYNCSAYSDEKLKNVANEVNILKNVLSEKFLYYYDTILHRHTKTLYFVLEYTSWRSVQELSAVCKATEKHFAESFIWYLLLELARCCKVVEDLDVVALKKCLRSESIFVGPNGEVRINCFELSSQPCGSSNLIQQVGNVIHSLCYQPGACEYKIKQFFYSDDLRDVISFLTDDNTTVLRSDVILYHPTVLTNTETLTEPQYFSQILVSDEYFCLSSENNKCDSEKAVELCKKIEPLPRTHFSIPDSPVYYNISPKQHCHLKEEDKALNDSLSPTIAALALELPGYVPRSRKPYSEALDSCIGPQRVSEETLSHQWMSRLVALRQREESLNQRERDILAKEMVNSPSTKIVSLEDSAEVVESNGITLPEMITQGKNNWVARRHQRRSSSTRIKPRRKSYAYEDLDSSLSADNGDGSLIITATKFTKDNMPRRNIFPEVATRKVHFTSSNPFIESDDSVTLTYYELEALNEEKQQSNNKSKVKDIDKFKYLDVEKVVTEKRAALHWGHSSPSKQAKLAGKVFSDITNNDNLKKTPSKTSLTSQTSKQSLNSHWSVDSGKGSVQTCLSIKSFAQTPKAPPEFKKTKNRKSLLPFKTPFKFMSSSTKV